MWMVKTDESTPQYFRQQDKKKYTVCTLICTIVQSSNIKVSREQRKKVKHLEK